MSPGRRGGLIGTGFISRSVPLIRYDTGDLATAVAFPSAANSWRLRVRDIGSRYSQDCLVTGEGGLVSFITLYPGNRRAGLSLRPA